VFIASDGNSSNAPLNLRTLWRYIN